MSQVRAQRVGEQIKKELSYLLQNEMKDPRIGFVTVTGVDMSRDLQQAQVYLSIMGDDDKKQKALQAIGKAAGFIRSEIGQKIRLRHTPELEFKIDESIEYGSRIDRIIEDLNQDKES